MLCHSGQKRCHFVTGLSVCEWMCASRNNSTSSYPQRSRPPHLLHNENQIINNGIFKIVSYLIGSIPKDSIDCKITIYPHNGITQNQLNVKGFRDIKIMLLFQLLALYPLSQTLDVHGSTFVAVKMHPGWFNQRESHSFKGFTSTNESIILKNQSSFMGPLLFDEKSRLRFLIIFYRLA